MNSVLGKPLILKINATALIFMKHNKINRATIDQQSFGRGINFGEGPMSNRNRCSASDYVFVIKCVDSCVLDVIRSAFLNNKDYM